MTDGQGKRHGWIEEFAHHNSRSDGSAIHLLQDRLVEMLKLPIGVAREANLHLEDDQPSVVQEESVGLTETEAARRIKLEPRAELHSGQKLLQEVLRLLLEAQARLLRSGAANRRPGEWPLARPRAPDALRPPKPSRRSHQRRHRAVHETLCKTVRQGSLHFRRPMVRRQWSTELPGDSVRASADAAEACHAPARAPRRSPWPAAH